MKGTGAKRNVCPGSCVSTGAKFPVAPVESAPMEGCKDSRLLVTYITHILFRHTAHIGCQHERQTESRYVDNQKPVHGVYPTEDSKDMNTAVVNDSDGESEREIKNQNIQASPTS